MKRVLLKTNKSELLNNKVEKIYIDLNDPGLKNKLSKSILVLSGVFTGLVYMFYLGIYHTSDIIFRIVYLVGGLLIVINSLMYLGNKSLRNFFGKSYFLLDDQQIQYKPSPYSKNKIHIKNRDIEKIKIRLFEIVVIMSNNEKIILNLNYFSDEN